MNKQMAGVSYKRTLATLSWQIPHVQIKTECHIALYLTLKTSQYWPLSLLFNPFFSTHTQLDSCILPCVSFKQKCCHFGGGEWEKEEGPKIQKVMGLSRPRKPSKLTEEASELTSPLSKALEAESKLRRGGRKLGRELGLELSESSMLP